jgi:DNA repair protein RadC
MRLAGLPHEEFHVVWLDNRQKVIAVERLFNGTIEGTTVHARETVRSALEHNAAAAIFAHNHPPGVAEPSAADRAITAELKRALELIGVCLLDHLVIGADVPVSLAERSLPSRIACAFTVTTNHLTVPAAAYEASLPPQVVIRRGAIGREP